MRCECINITHQAKCSKQATKRCQQCGAVLCGGCAKKHHVHNTIAKLEAR